MIYQTRHTNNDRKKILIRFLLVLVFLLVFGFFTPLRTIVLSVASPFFQSGDYLNSLFIQLPKFLVDKNKIIKENEELDIEIERLRVAILDYQMLKDENQRLIKELGFSAPPEFVGAKVLARSPQIALDTLLIDQGEGALVGVGSIVLAHERVLLGKVQKVSSNRAIVALNSFPSVVSYGFVERTHELIEIKGVGGGNMEVEVPIDFDIKLADIVIAEGSQDAVLAIVGSVEENLSSGFKKVLLSLPVNVSKTRVVFVEPAPVDF